MIMKNATIASFEDKLVNSFDDDDDTCLSNNSNPVMLNKYVLHAFDLTGVVKQ